MREILFRGKQTDTGEWVEGSYLKMDECAYIMPPVKYTGITIVEMFVRVNPETVGQYTGLKDGSGAKIFEGDIIAMGQGKVPSMVFWSDSCKRFQFHNIRRNEDHDADSHAIKFIGEIIGNIHDNPNLIAEGE